MSGAPSGRSGVAPIDLECDEYNDDDGDDMYIMGTGASPGARGREEKGGSWGWNGGSGGGGGARGRYRDETEPFY